MALTIARPQAQRRHGAPPYSWANRSKIFSRSAGSTPGTGVGHPERLPPCRLHNDDPIRISSPPGGRVLHSVVRELHDSLCAPRCSSSRALPPLAERPPAPSAGSAHRPGPWRRCRCLSARVTRHHREPHEVRVARLWPAAAGRRRSAPSGPTRRCTAGHLRPVRRVVAHQLQVARTIVIGVRSSWPASSRNSAGCERAFEPVEHRVERAGQRGQVVVAPSHLVRRLRSVALDPLRGTAEPQPHRTPAPGRPPAHAATRGEQQRHPTPTPPSTPPTSWSTSRPARRPGTPPRRARRAVGSSSTVTGTTR